MARSFVEIMMKDQPPLNQAHVESAIGRRRARGFSEIIATATRGMDAGQNAFKPQRRDLNSDPYRTDSWHVRFLGQDGLGKADFNTVHKGSVLGLPHAHLGIRTGRTKRPPMHKPAATRAKNPFSRTPKLKKFDEVIEERRAEKYADDQSFPKGEIDMDVSQEQIKKHAMQNPEAASLTYGRDQLYGAIDSMARESQKPCESIEHARVRVGKSVEGAAILKAYNLAPRSAPVAKSASVVSSAEARKSLPGGSVLVRHEALATKLAGEKGVSMVKARALAWAADGGALKKEYDASASSSRARNISGGRM